MIIESMPIPAVGLDAQSSAVDDLMLDDLQTRGNNLDVAPAWPNILYRIPLTYIFHLHHGVKFHERLPLTARDIEVDLRLPAAGKGAQRKSSGLPIRQPHRRDRQLHRDLPYSKKPSATFLWNLWDGAMGIVPYSSGNKENHGHVARPLAARSRTRTLCSPPTTSTGAKKARLSKVRFIVVPDRARWNCTKAAPTSPSTP